ncbi:cupin domain-containing protein [Aspergillus neoniger CBS 115656]|uniref:RmlC-like cupin n=1 Tax=Aspergillus neoniger (strain CBS 115656) TaxID=1448310 RepID=A0A318Y4Z9_ASPNB|nr:RmlC-like cupin [Aspergillus neoniger CBS 115656]PYH29306.1 RmlC-like cupin [Aspergillus neoniger CBS 115656]
MPTQKTHPVIHHRQAISSPPPESFPNPAHGHLTWRTLLSSPQTPTSDMCAGLAVCPPRTGHLCRHRHTQAEIYYITSGSGHVFIDGNEYEVFAGTVVFIPGDAEHGVVNRSGEPLEWFYVFPTGSFGDVVYRFEEGTGVKEGERKVRAKI